MPRGGARKGAGRPRKPRTPDELRELADQIEADNPSPDSAPGHRYETALDFAMAVINDDTKPLSERRRLAIAALPFQHARITERPQGKKDERKRAAQTAGEGSGWGADLAFEPTSVN